MGGSVTQFSIEPPDQTPTKFEVEPPAGQSQGEPKTPGFFKRLTAPYNPEVQDSNPLVRGLDAAGGALLGTPGAVYHAFADKPTPEENAKFHGDTAGLKRVGLGLHRLVVDPVASAAEDYASGKVTPEAAMSVLPEAIGVGVGSQAAGELSGRGLSKVGELRTQFRDSMGGGKVQPFARKFTGVESELKDTVADNVEKQGKAEVKHAEASGDVEARKDLAKKLDQSSVKLGEHIGKVEESVAKEANSKFEAVREKVGNPETPATPLVEAVKSAETNILQGIPENIKEFRSIMGHGEEVPAELREAYTRTTGEAPEGAAPITWDKLQSLKSRIDARLRQAGRTRMNGDVKRALYSVQNTIVDTMGGLAEANGAADLWQDAKNTWRQYKQDFHEPTGPSGSGSPVAAALDAVDPKNIRQPFVAKQSAIGNRGLDILRKYPQHGGNEAAATAEEMLGHHESIRRMPDKALPKPLQTPVVDAAKVATDAIAKKARNWGSFNARDIGILGESTIGGALGFALGGPGGALAGVATPFMYEGAKYGMSRALNKPAIVEWLSKTPPEEAAVIAKIPGADKVNIINMLTDQAMRSGKPVKLSPAAVQLIGPANVARIAAATGSVAATRVQNRKDALDLLKQ